MRRAIYETVEADADPREVAWHNLREADRELDLSHMMNAMMGYLASHATSNYQDVEREFRSRDFNTHLLAKPITAPILLDGSATLRLLRGHHSIFDDIGDAEPLKYELSMLVRHKEAALRGVLEDWPSYETNLEALEFAGCIVLNDCGPKKPAPPKITDLYRVTVNQVRIVRFETVPPFEAIGIIRAEISADMEVPENELRLRRFGKYDGVDMMTLFHNGNHVSHMAIALYPSEPKLVQWCMTV